MDALDIIPLETAKQYLVVDFPDHDQIITNAIKTAVDWVERYTDYALYQRTVLLDMHSCHTKIYTYPIEIESVKTTDGIVTAYTAYPGELSLTVYSQYGKTIQAVVGYPLVQIAAIPPTLIAACYKLITYLYENRDTFGLSLPVDIQGLINQNRRDATI